MTYTLKAPLPVLPRRAPFQLTADMVAYAQVQVFNTVRPTMTPAQVDAAAQRFEARFGHRRGLNITL